MVCAIKFFENKDEKISPPSIGLVCHKLSEYVNSPLLNHVNIVL